VAKKRSSWGHTPDPCRHDHSPWACAFKDEIDWRSWEPTGLGGVGVLLDATIIVRCGPFNPLRGGPADLNACADAAGQLLGVNVVEHVEDAWSKRQGATRQSWPAVAIVSVPGSSLPGERGHARERFVEEREAANPEHALDNVVAAARGVVARYYLQTEQPKITATTWPPELGWVLHRLDSLSERDLPPTPWALRETQTKVISLGIAFGGRVATVIDNASWLANMKLDVKLGAAGSRYRTGVIFDDLHALARVLRERTPGMSFGF
jgi:hypothetical protein